MKLIPSRRSSLTRNVLGSLVARHLYAIRR